jgi:uncharacterized membrane protein YphA (DoxX/SURF4 family)
MNTALWIAQVLLAVAMLGAGAMKVIQSKDKLLASGTMNWTEDFTESQIKGIGLLEILAAIGLILPGLLDVAPILTPIAAVGVALTMIGAAATHVRRGEHANVAVPVILLALAVFIAIGRFGPEPL